MGNDRTIDQKNPEGEPARRPLQDAQRAVSLVRSKAAEWKLDSNRIGIVGFSAGGHSAIATATGFEKRTYPSLDEVDKLSCRPDFAVSVYPGYLKRKDGPSSAWTGTCAAWMRASGFLNAEHR